MTQAEFEKLIEKAVALRKKKNSDYGNSFLQAYNLKEKINTNMGNMVLYFDLHRKIGRIDHFLLTDKINEVSDETLEDTLVDLAIMCLNGAIALKARKSGLDGEQKLQS